MMEETNLPVRAHQSEEIEKKKSKKQRGLSWLTLLLALFLFLELIDSVRGIVVHVGRGEFQSALIK